MVRSRAFAFALSCVSFAAIAGEPTAEQLKLFQQLPADQQRALLQQYQGRGSAEVPSMAVSPAKAEAEVQSVAPRPSGVRRDAWREFDLRRIALEDPELESCLRRYEPDDLLALRSVAETAGTRQVQQAMLPWDLRRRIGLLGPEIEPDRLTPGLSEPSEIQEVLRGQALWIDIWGCSDRYTQFQARNAELIPFGYDLFAGSPDSFAPPVDLPVPADYQVGPGDAVDVQLFGKENEQYRLVVTRDGHIGLPGIGPVAVAGMSFERMVKTIEQRIAQQKIGVRASVTMGPLRTIQVFVLGEAFRPGTYTISGLATITHALVASGGVKPIGSLRSIELKRGGRTIRTLDLYDLLLRGDTRDDLRLQPGDAVFVPPVGITVAVAGEVRRPGIYEVRSGEKAEALVELAGGMLPTAYPKSTRLERIGTDRKRAVQDVDLTTKAGLETKVEPGDYLRIYSVLERMDSFVRIDGYVLRPGVYQWREGMRISELIRGTEELQPKPDLDYVLVRREIGPERRIEVFSVSLARAWRTPGGVDDIELKARDRIYAFGLEENRQPITQMLVRELEAQSAIDRPALSVSIRGTVRSGGVYPLETGMSVRRLIEAAGGLRQEAFRFDAELTRYTVVDGKVREAQHQPIDLAALLAGDTTKDILLAPFDVVSIKPIPLWGESESVELRGEVRFPGVYTITRGETLRSVIARAGGLTADAFSQGAVFSRVSLRVREQQQMDILARKLEADIASMALLGSQSNDSNAQEALLVGRSLIAQVKGAKAPGRLVIDLPSLMSGQRELEMQSGDRLVVPRKPSGVTVIGEVQFPTSHLQEPGDKLKDFIAKSGGFTQKANDDAVYVVRSNGRVDVGSAAKDVGPGDTIVVPFDTERMRPIVYWSTITQILYQLGLFLAAADTVGIL